MSLAEPSELSYAKPVTTHMLDNAQLEGQKLCAVSPPTSGAPCMRARRGDDVHTERSPQVGRDQALLLSVLGSHVADFGSF